jgi:hypothetical protein
LGDGTFTEARLLVWVRVGQDLESGWILAGKAKLLVNSFEDVARNILDVGVGDP